MVCLPSQVELARQDAVDGMDGAPAGAHVADDMAPAHQATQRPVPRGLERETSLPPPVSSKEIVGADGTYERVGSCKDIACRNFLTLAPLSEPVMCTVTYLASSLY